MNKKISKIIVILVLCGLTSIMLHSQAGRGKGRVTGIVFDEEGKPLEGVVIKVKGLAVSREMDTKTNKKGAFAVLGLGTGKWRISTKIKGYLPKFMDKNVSQFEQSKAMEFNLKKAPENTITDNTVMKAVQKAKGFYEKKNYKEALALYQTILKDNVDLFFLKINIANCYKDMGNTEKAVSSFHEIITELKNKKESYIQDVISRAYVFIAGHYAGKKDYKKAEIYFEKATVIIKKDENLFYNLGELYINSNKTDKAIIAFKTATEINPGWGAPLGKLGYAYLGLGKMAEAVTVFDKYIKNFPESKDKKDIEAMLPELRKMVPKK